jgi:hypothetical protein
MENICPHCGVINKPALEHKQFCPYRLSFYGAPPEWGVGSPDEIRIYNGTAYKFTYTWFPMFEEKE